MSDFDRQIDRLIDLGYHESAGLDEAALRDRLEPLRAGFAAAATEQSELPPVIVIGRELVGEEALVAPVARSDGQPETLIDADAMRSYSAIDGLDLPAGGAYLLTGASKEPETRNLPPQEALKKIAAAGRTPLTIEEGLALHLHVPDVIAQNDGFSLAGSTRGDRRVPALWVSKGRPKLGWCYMGAPHTWLATASVAKRIAA